MTTTTASPIRRPILAFAVMALSFLFTAISLPAQPGARAYVRPQNGVPQYPDQNSRAWIVGQVLLSPDEEGGKETPGAGVTVVVVATKATASKPDTMYAVVGGNGRFFFRDLRPGKADVSFSLIGYQEEAKTITLTPGENKFIANLSPVKYELEGAVVKEAAKPVSIKGDTIVFHASAVKVEKGESALEVLEQMPGVEVAASSVKVLNEEVANVYVDGALLFGKAPMTALTNLPAEEVVTIRSYQEYANKDPNHKISKNESMQRSIDIETKSKAKVMKNLFVTTGAGFDTDSTYHKFRYTLGAAGMLMSEKLQASLQFNVNNINDDSVQQRRSTYRSASSGGAADLKAGSFNLGLNRRWMSKEVRNFELGSLGGNYSYSTNYQVNESVTDRIYFPNDKYESRDEYTRSSSISNSGSHSLSVRGSKSLTDGAVSASASASLSTSGSETDRLNRIVQDMTAPEGTSTHSDNKSGSRSFKTSLNAHKGFNHKVTLSGGASFNISDGDGSGNKVDTTLSTITRTVLDLSSESDSRSFGANAGARFELSERTSLGMGYSYNNSYSHKVQWAYDVTDPALSPIDSVNTYDRTNDSNTHNANLDFRTALMDDKVILAAGLAFKSTGINREDAFPYEEPFMSRRFNSLIPSFSMGTKTQLDNWNISWAVSTDNPSIEELRPRLNNSNLFSVSVGNPELQQSRTNTFKFSYNTVLGRNARATIRETGQGGLDEDRFMAGPQHFSTFSASAQFGTTSDKIVSKRVYFAEQTYLPQYDYTMPGRSTLTTHENASGSYSASANARLGLSIEKIMCMLNISASMSWDRNPSYIDDLLTSTDNYRPSLSVGLRSNFSRKIRFNLGASASYVYSDNSAKDKTTYWNEALRAGFELNNLIKHTYFGGNYSKTFMQGMALSSINDNVLDLRGGFRFGPKNEYDLSFNVHDLFNRNRGFTTSMNADYITNSWKHNFGRYVMFKFAYRFGQFGGGGFGGPRR